jgi:Zn-dependent M28 family amino/carboxypeptidase
MFSHRLFSVGLRYAALPLFSLQFIGGLSGQTIHYKPVDRALVETRLKSYGGNDKQREATLKQMFIAAGCDEQHLSEQAVKGTRQPNVICVLPGSSERCIVVGAHFDHVSEGDGVVDNWSGASLLPSLLEAVKVEPRKHTYIFIGFTDEEKGEIGSHFYVHQMTKEQVASTDAMVNLDTLGLGATEIWASHTDKRLQALIIYIAKAMNVPLSGVDVDGVGSTDSVQFEARKIPSTTIHSLTQETWDARILHTSKDRLSAMRLDDYYQSYRLTAAFLAALDQWPFDTKSSAH